MDNKLMENNPKNVEEMIEALQQFDPKMPVKKYDDTLILDIRSLTIVTESNYLDVYGKPIKKYPYLLIV